MHAEAVQLEPDSSYPFWVTAKRYVLGALSDEQCAGRRPVTLLLLHSTGFHKEIFEPVLEDLANMQGVGSLGIREAWAVECPNHGESAVLNAEMLKQAPYDEYFSCEKYAEAAYRFLTAKGPDKYVKTSSDRIVCIGHSLGGCTAIFLSALFQFSSIILVDPFLYPGDTVGLTRIRERLVKSAHERRDVWSSRQEAREFLGKKGGWDDRVMDLYVKHGLREHPHASRQTAPYKGVTLACTREQEATMYRDLRGALKPMDQLTAICQRIPVYVAFAGDSDHERAVIPRKIQERIADPAIRRFASKIWIEGVGHLVPQQAPHAVAQFIYDSLQNVLPRL